MSKRNDLQVEFDVSVNVNVNNGVAVDNLTTNFPLVRAVSAVVVCVTPKRLADTKAVVALELTGVARFLR